MVPIILQLRNITVSQIVYIHIQTYSIENSFLKHIRFSSGTQDGKSNSSGSQGEPSAVPPTIPTGNGNNNGTGSSSGGRRSHSSGSDRGAPADHTRPVIFL